MPINSYNLTTDIYIRSGTLPREQFLNSFIVTNIGDTPFTFNGKILFPSATPTTAQGDSISFGGNENEIYVGKMVLAFQLPLGAIPRCEIVRKYFTDVK
jgi:hypothetical protein